MIQIQDTVLVIRNARDKVQSARYKLFQEGNTYIIERYTGQFGGKITQQPTKIIEKGKAKRSVLQQAKLEYNSLIKKAVDKGYKKLADLTKTKFDEISVEELNDIVPTIKTDANGNIKVQHAKSSNNCANSVLDKEFFASRKLDGVRVSMKLINGAIATSSRGGGNYDVPTTLIRENEQLLSFFKKNPDIILDGELYVHGWPLQKISGACRKKEWIESRHAPLEFWVFDIIDPKVNFNERLDILIDMNLELEGNKKVKILEHVFVEGWTRIKKLHDKYISEGYEGLVLRKPNKKYSPGAKNSDWIKVKEYQDAEFEITGISEGLREEDFCFVLKTKAGKSFKAKPMGSREVRAEYLENWPLYVGKLGTVQFFELSEDKVPIGNTTFKSIRDKNE